jgi:hypothetical protein
MLQGNSDAARGAGAALLPGGDRTQQSGLDRRPGDAPQPLPRRAVAVAVGDAAGGALDLHGGISNAFPRNIGPSGPGCPRSRHEHRLISDSGDVVLCRCKAPNLCPYCRKLAVVEMVEMLMIDAMRWPPTMGVVLTAREFLERPDTYRVLQAVRKDARHTWPAYQDHIQVEFQRRGALHLNLLGKGVPVEEEAEYRGSVVLGWCDRVDADPDKGQWVEALTERRGGAGGFVKYISKVMAHGLKQSQAPRIGWRGHQTSQTAGYFAEGAAVARAEAKASLQLKRELRKAIEEGHQGEDAEYLASERLAWRQRKTWTFVSSREIATEVGWRQLASQMRRRDEPPAYSWGDLDDELRELAVEDAEVLEVVRAVFPDAAYER